MCIYKAIIGGPGIVAKCLRKNLKAIPRKHSVDTLQKTAVHGTSHIIRKVLQSENCGLSGGDHRGSEAPGRKGV